MGGNLPAVVARARNLVAEALDAFDAQRSGGAPQAFVACSGGADSLALAAAAGFLAQRKGYSVGALVVDHGLQTGSAEVAEKAASQCADLGLSPVRVLKAHVSGNLNEADAREARYAAIEEFLSADAAYQNSPVLLAHTLNDQAEQVLLGLARGSGTRAIAGIPPVRGRYVRPFLPLSREDMEAICHHAHLDFWVDPTNLETDALRNQVRLTLLPALADTLGAVYENLARTAELARDDADYLDELADEVLRDAMMAPPSSSEVKLDVNRLTQLPRALTSRVVRQAAIMVGGKAPDFERTRAVLGLLRLGPSTGPVQLEGHVDVIRTTEVPRGLVFRSARPKTAH